ncbi:MAG TPA: hypothetical protein VGL80_21470 [Pseudonocardiaceae bacterium]|jgi:hypothetical protein
MRSRTLLVAGVGVAAVLALTGCAPNSITGSAAPQGAATQHTNVGTTAASVADLGAAVQHNAAEKNSVHVDMNVTVPGAGALTASGDMRFAGTKSAVHLTMDLPSVGNMEMVVVDGTFYMKLPAGLASLMGGSDDKPWAKVDLGSTDAITQSLGSTADFANQVDPTQMINQIKSAGTITKVTHETLNGQQTTHYAITVDVAKLAGAEKQSMAGLGVTTLPFDIWVNSDNLPVRIITKVGYADPVSGSSQQVAVTVNYTNWGQPVTVTAPPADQVGTLDGH